MSSDGRMRLMPTFFAIEEGALTHKPTWLAFFKRIWSILGIAAFWAIYGLYKHDYSTLFIAVIAGLIVVPSIVYIRMRYSSN